MPIGHFMALGYILVFIGALIVGLIRPYKIGKLWQLSALVLTCAVAVFGSTFTITERMDLYRLGRVIDVMRLSNPSLFDAVFGHANDEYGGLYSFRLLCYLVSKTDSDNWMAVASITVTFGLLLTVLIDYLRSENYTTRALLPSVALMFMGLVMPYIFQGIRNSIAVATSITSAYLMFYKKKYYALAVWLYCIAITMHPVVLILLPTILIGFMPKYQLVFRIVAVASMPLFFFAADILTRLPVTFLQSIGNSINKYTDRAYFADRPEMIANIAVFLALSLGYWCLKRDGIFRKENYEEKVYMNAYYFLGLMMIGCAIRRDFSLRIGYIMDIAAIPVFNKIIFRRQGNTKNGNDIVILLIVVMGLIVCCAKVFYDCWFNMSRWIFY